MITATTFNQHRSHLFGIAYRMLGSAMDAEDVLQEAFIRWQKQDDVKIKSPQAFLTTIVTRLALDQLRSARVKREEYYGEWLPEPIITNSKADPGHMTELGESLSMAFLVMLERLSPVQRAVFLLRDVFAYEYGEIAGILEKSESNCRQILRRARQQIAGNRPRFKATRHEQQQLLTHFNQACEGGDLDEIIKYLSEDIVWCSDGGGKAPAALHPVTGPDRVGRFILGLWRQKTEFMTIVFHEINGHPGLVVMQDGRPLTCLTAHFQGKRIWRIYAITNPNKLHHLTRSGENNGFPGSYPFIL